MVFQKLNTPSSWSTETNPGDITSPDHNTLYTIKNMWK